MNTVIWVLMAVGSHDWAAPTLEFTTQARCEAASQQIRLQTKEYPHRKLNNITFCVRIEK